MTTRNGISISTLDLRLLLLLHTLALLHLTDNIMTSYPASISASATRKAPRAVANHAHAGSSSTGLLLSSIVHPFLPGVRTPSSHRTAKALVAAVARAHQRHALHVCRASLILAMIEISAA